MDQTRFKYLLKAYLEHSGSPAELQEFAALIDQLDDKTLSDLVAANWNHHEASNRLDEKEAEDILENILQTKNEASLSKMHLSIGTKPPSASQLKSQDNITNDNFDQKPSQKEKHVMTGPLKMNGGLMERINKYLPVWYDTKGKRKLLMTAAVIAGFLILTGTLWQLLAGKDDPSKKLLTHTNIFRSGKSDVAPGTSGAILTLASGQQVILDSLSADGEEQLLAGTVGTAVQLKAGGIEYSRQTLSDKQPLKYNTLSTPASRVFRLKLPDGTQVWLNAASSIRYPVAFNKNAREVTITGEAYFEVAKLQKADGTGRVPFIVDIQTDQPTKSPSRIEVLGTHFNINAYADEGKIKTTLLEGRVNVFAAASNKAVAIVPGDQAVMGTSINSQVHVHPTDIQKAVAWKNGYFDFNQAGLKEVMEQIGRWYNVEIVYASGVPERKFWGKIQRSLYLTQVLSLLEQVDIHFKIVKNQLIVMP